MTTTLERAEGSASRSGRSLPPGKTRYPLYRKLGVSQDRSGQVWKISPPPPGFDPRTVQPVVSRYTYYATRPTSYCKGLMYFRRYTWADIPNKCRQMHPYITKNTILLTPHATPTRFNSRKVILREYNWYMFTAWSTKWVTRRKFQFTLQSVLWRSSCVRSYCTH
jgi:hypothetical protein